MGDVAFPAYLTLLLVGFGASIAVARRHAAAAGIAPEHIVDLGLIALFTGIVGARVLSVLADGMFMDFVHLCTDPRRVEALDRLVDHCTSNEACGFDYVCDPAGGFCHPPRNCLAALEFWNGGLTFYGGLLFAVPACALWARRRGLAIRSVADVTAPAVMVGLFFGRLGCFFNGCCWGAATDSIAGVTFPGQPGPVHPTQLYEAAAALALFAVLRYAVRPRTRAAGELFAWMVVLYAAVRFGLEFLRADPRGGLGLLSTSQLLGVVLGGAAAAFIAHVRICAARAKPAVP